MECFCFYLCLRLMGFAVPAGAGLLHIGIGLRATTTRCFNDWMFRHGHNQDPNQDLNASRKTRSQSSPKKGVPQKTMRPKKTILCVDDNEQTLSVRKFML